MGIETGRVKRLSDRVRRLTAPNPGAMTGPGTNTYLVGNEQVAVIDPGPLIDSHVERILEEAGERIRWVVVTHTHRDHSPAAAPLLDATGAEPVGCVMTPDDARQDTTFNVDRNVRHGERIRGPDFTLEALHTPGHIGNHFCYLLREEGMLFAGDHMMEGVSVVILPPSGDLKEFMASLELLKDYPIEAIAPAHGELMTEPAREIDKLVKHRQYRERKVVAALRETDGGSIEQLVPRAYDDTDPSLYKMAAYSLWAHLLKLEREGLVERSVDRHWAYGEEHWRLL